MRLSWICPKMTMSSGSISANTKKVISAAAKKEGHIIHINERHFIARSPAEVMSGLGLDVLFGHDQAPLNATVANFLIAVVGKGQINGDDAANDSQGGPSHEDPWPRLAIPRPSVFILSHVTRLFGV